MTSTQRGPGGSRGGRGAPPELAFASGTSMIFSIARRMPCWIPCTVLLLASAASGQTIDGEKPPFTDYCERLGTRSGASTGSSPATGPTTSAASTQLGPGRGRDARADAPVPPRPPQSRRWAGRERAGGWGAHRDGQRRPRVGVLQGHARPLRERRRRWQDLHEPRAQEHAVAAGRARLRVRAGRPLDPRGRFIAESDAATSRITASRPSPSCSPDTAPLAPQRHVDDRARYERDQRARRDGGRDSEGAPRSGGLEHIGPSVYSGMTTALSASRDFAGPTLWSDARTASGTTPLGPL